MQEDVIICKNIKCSSIITAAYPAGQQKYAEHVVSSDVRLGNPSVVNASLDLKTDGSINGTGKAATSELIGPSGSFTKGAAYCHDFEIAGFGTDISAGGGGPAWLLGNSRFYL